MDLLEMPLDHLAFRFYSLPAIAASSLLTWLAVIAAAVGLWRIRSAGSRSDVSALPSPPAPHPPPRIVGATGADVVTPAREEAEPMVPSPRTPKVRFTAYYDAACGGGFRNVDEDGEEEMEMEVDDDDGFSEPIDGAEVEMTAPWTGGASRMEGMMVGWRGDLGWYDYQDITALNGRVVRLWDGEGGLTAAQKRTGRMGRYAF
ncbi:uncharacterized protein [Typha angustifolia]|uniref:uncharacterized protein n=1 Tax=Typha angustifolia TaxID=59011 RepID=UPI003C2BA124